MTRSELEEIRAYAERCRDKDKEVVLNPDLVIRLIEYIYTLESENTRSRFLR